MKKRLIHTFLFSSLLLISVFFPTQKSFAAQCYDKNGQGIPLSAISNSSMCTSPNQWLDVAPPTNVTVLGAPAPQQVAVPEKPAWCDGFIDCLFSLSTGALSVAAGKIIAPLLSMLAFVILKIVSLFMGLAGILLNYTLQETVVNMTARINSVTGINVAWKVIRDLMNIGFIFLLLYEGIKLILSQDNIDSIRKFILGIVLASLLINFSLFFTKVIIDTSNIFTIGIYNIIIGDTDSTGTVATVSTSNAYGGLSNAFMSALGVQEFFSTKSLPLPGGTGGLEDDYSHLTTNIMASILIIITTVVFLAVTFMFITRYIVLIFLLALSPIAYMGMALPGVGSYAKSWWDSLWGQIIFGPLYMIMTWVTLTLIAGNLAQPVDAQSIGVQSMQDTGGFASSANILFNFTLVIGMTIASLVTAKNFSTKGAKEIGKLSSGITSFAGSAIFGTAGAIGRRSFGRAALWSKSEEDLKAEAAKGGIRGATASTRLALATGSYDARRSPVGESLSKNTGVNFGKGIPFNEKFGEGGMAGTRANQKKDREQDIDAVLKSYIDKRDWSGLATYMKDGKPTMMSSTEWEKRQQYAYKKLDAKNRIAVDSALADPALSKKLQSKIPVDDQIKVYTDAKEWDNLADFIASKPDGTPRGAEDQADIYRKINDRDRAALEETTWGKSPAGLVAIASMRKTLPFDEQITIYKNRKDWSGLATFLRSKTKDQQDYIFEKLTARDRVELEAVLTPTEITALRGELSKEEEEKTITESKKVVRARDQDAKILRINDFATGVALPAGSTIQREIGTLDPKQASNLSAAALTHIDVIRSLTSQHLKDIVENGDPAIVDNTVKATIVAQIEADNVTAGGNATTSRTPQHKYLHQNIATEAMWNI